MESNNKDQTPIDAEQIKNTDWLMVKSKNQDIFYYNKKLNLSTWDIPEELYSNTEFTDQLYKFKTGKELFRVEDKPIVKSSIPVETNSTVNYNDPNMSLQEKIKIFNQLLLEKTVSAFSTWEKEAEKLKDDPRFHIFSLKEQKIYFNEFLKNKASIEAENTRKERMEKKLKFFEFLKTVVVDPRMKYLEFSSKYNDKPEFNIFTRTKEREDFFHEFIESFMATSVTVDPVKIKQNYFNMLNELKLDTNKPRKELWQDVKSHMKKDLRFINVGGSKERKDWFKQYLKNKKEEEEYKNLTKSEIEKLSIEKRKKAIEQERRDSTSKKLKSLRSLEHTTVKNTILVFLNSHVIDGELPLDHVRDMVITFCNENKIDFCHSVNDNTLTKIIETHLEKVRIRNDDLFKTTVDELFQVGTINFEMSIKEVLAVMYKARTIMIHRKENDLELLYDKYKQEKISHLLKDFEQLLNENVSFIKLIFKREDIYERERDTIKKEIYEKLKADIRFVRLNFVPIKRDKLLFEKLEKYFIDLGIE